MDFTSRTIAEYASELAFDDIPEPAVEAATRLVYDSLGCCMGAYTSPPSKHLRSLYGDIDARETATIFGDGSETMLEYAALINSTLVRYLDFNDTYISQGRACHPSDHIPALLGVAEAEGADGETLIESIVLAYEIEGAGLDTGVTWDHGYDYVTWGAFSSVAAVGNLLDFDVETYRNALGIAGSSNLTLGIARRGAVSMWKGIAHPYVTHNAVQACAMAEEGITGPDAVFEGPDGFWEVAAGRPLEFEGLGGSTQSDFRITDAHIKPYPCGYYMQPIIAGIVDIVESEGIEPASVTAVDIETFEHAADVLAGEEKWATDLTRESADHSIPYTASIAILFGDITPTHYDREYRENERVHSLMEKVSVAVDPQLTDMAGVNPNSTPSVITIETTEGSHRTHVNYAPGHAENPLSDAELESKFRGMCEPLMTESQLRTIRTMCESLPELSSVDPLIAELTV